MRAKMKRNPKTDGRPYPTHTNLGKILHHLHITKTWLANQSQVHERTLTEYLAGRKEMLSHHRAAIAEALDIPEHYL
jgi:hypothetical protein